MTVKELIDELQKYPDNMEVVFYTEDRGYRRMLKSDVYEDSCPAYKEGKFITIE
jgi:hypothetical protein